MVSLADRLLSFPSLAMRHADAERVLLSHAHVWLRRIPSSLHPKRLGRLHPGHVNRLAALWDDAPARDRLLDELIDAARSDVLADGVRVLDEVSRLEQWAHKRIEVIYPALDARGRRRVVAVSPA